MAAIVEEVEHWLTKEAGLYSLQSPGASPLVTSEHVLRAAQVLLGVAPRPEAGDVVDVAPYYLAIDKATRHFFDLLHCSSWRFVKEKSGVQIMRREAGDPTVLTMKGSTTIHCTPEALCDIVMDTTQSAKWDVLLQKVTVLQVLNPQAKILHMQYVAEHCFLREAHDFVILLHWFRRPEDGSICIVGFSVDHPAGAAQEGFIRSQMKACGYLITPSRDHSETCRVTQLVSVKVMQVAEIMMEFVARAEPLTLLRLKNFTHELLGRESAKSLGRTVVSERDQEEKEKGKGGYFFGDQEAPSRNEEEAALGAGKVESAAVQEAEKDSVREGVVDFIKGREKGDKGLEQKTMAHGDDGLESGLGE